MQKSREMKEMETLKKVHSASDSFEKTHDVLQNQQKKQFSVPKTSNVLIGLFKHSYQSLREIAKNRKTFCKKILFYLYPQRDIELEREETKAYKSLQNKEKMDNIFKNKKSNYESDNLKKKEVLQKID